MLFVVGLGASLVCDVCARCVLFVIVVCEVACVSVIFVCMVCGFVVFV